MNDAEFDQLLVVLGGKGWTRTELGERVHPLRPLVTLPAPTPPSAARVHEEATGGAAAAAGEVARQPLGMAEAVDLPELIERVLPAVVQVVATKRSRKKATYSQGSGFAIAPIPGDEDVTIVVTNAHVTDPGDEFMVRWGEDSFYRADLLNEDPDNDLALLLVPIKPPATLSVRYLRDVRRGESVIAIGSPLGLTETVTTGIVSALDRRIQSFSGAEVSDAIQTSAPINSGNSGGPLIGMDGSVLGVNTQGPRDATGIGFAMPAETALRQVVNLGR